MIRRKDRRLVEAIRNPEKSDREWSEFRKTQELDSLDFGQLRLVPMVLRSLRRPELDHDIEKAKGLARWIFTRSVELKRSALEAAAAMRTEGLRICALKGLALSVGHGVSLAERPMWDADILVDDLERGMAVLKRLGYLRQWQGYGHAIPFRRGHSVIDLHRHALHQEPGFNVLDRAKEVEGMLIPEPTVFLIHVISHGVDTHSDSMWLFDALRLLPQADLGRVEDYAEKRKIRGLFGGALMELRDERCSPVGKRLLSRMEAPERRDLESVRRQL